MFLTLCISNIVLPNRYYFKSVFFVAVIPKLYFQHRITFKHPIVVAVIPNRFSSRIMFFVGFIPKLYFHVRFPFRTEPNKNRRCRSNTKTVLLSNPCFRFNNSVPMLHYIYIYMYILYIYTHVYLLRIYIYMCYSVYTHV